MLTAVNCPATLIEAGFMTNFEEAKLMLNPIYITQVAEGACQGVCQFLDVQYIPRTDFNAYPMLIMLKEHKDKFRVLILYIPTLIVSKLKGR